ncbi:hypothetical protein VIC_002395 [Vibrio coralliilyticus ATCC BAA-450]|nr:hypothetical protein VIC_002395 [Vibrio coralliilyticus ATCC BAA-450]
MDVVTVLEVNEFDGGFCGALPLTRNVLFKLWCGNAAVYGKRSD